VESAAIQFPWRQLGELLVAEELLTEDELEQALAEQAKTGRLLGQILVSNSYLSAFSLARVLSEQHGVQLSPKEGAPAPPAPVAARSASSSSIWNS
jgi:MSHA biogenesis protein MshE